MTLCADSSPFIPQSEYVTILEEKCRSGNIAALNHILRLNLIDSYLINMSNIFPKMCRIGRKEAAVWLSANFDLNIKSWMGGFSEACAVNDLTILRWLVDNFNYKRPEYRKEILRHIGFATSLVLVKWCVAYFEFSQRELCRPGGLAEIMMSEGEITVFHWLVTTFKPTHDMIRTYSKDSFVMLCETGHEKTLQWLVDRYNLSPSDIGSYCKNVSFEAKRKLMTDAEALAAMQEMPKWIYIR
jgi:hypothetical protein